MTKTEARQALAREIAKRGMFRTGGQVMNDGSVTLDWFCKNRFFLLKEGGDWSEETAGIKKGLIQKNILDDLGEIPLINLDRFTLQMHVNRLAKICAKDTVLQMRSYIREMCAEAVDQDFMYIDPSTRVTLPKYLRPTDKTTLTWDQLRIALETLEEQDRILLELDMTDALRPGELFALRWRCFDPIHSKLVIQETVYKGKIRSRAKTLQSLGPVHIPRKLAADIEPWKTKCPDASPEAFIFPNENGSFLDTDDYRKRVLKRLAEILNFPNLTFQIIRRTMATLSQTKEEPRQPRESCAIPARRPQRMSTSRSLRKKSRRWSIRFTTIYENPAVP